METGVFGGTGGGKKVFNDQRNLEQMKRQIEEMRNLLHLVFQNNKTFYDPEVNGLSQQLDDLIVEYQKRLMIGREKKQEESSFEGL